MSTGGRPPIGRASAASGDVWTGVGIGAAGFLLTLALGCVTSLVLAGLFGTVLRGSLDEANPASWQEAAQQTSLQLVEPTFLPPASGRPDLATLGRGQVFQTVTATYENGLVITQKNQPALLDGAGRVVRVEGAEDARLVRSRGLLTLQLLREKSSVTLSISESSNLSEDDLVRVARSLQPVRS